MIITVVIAVGAALTGLLAGIYLAFVLAVSPGLRRVDDVAFTRAVRATNRAIVNPLFLLLWLGSPVVLVIAAVVRPTPLTIIAAALAVLSTLLTVVVHLPLNRALDGADDGPAARTAYERPWNRGHLLRTAVTAAAFVVALVSLSSR